MKLAFLHTSDIHGYIMPTDYQKKGDYTAPFSLSRASTLIQKEREKFGADNVVVTDAGDLLQGAPLATYTSKQDYADGIERYTEAFNKVGYDARVLGNHDFDYGLDYLTYYIDHTKAPMLNDNVLDEQTGMPFAGRQYTIVEKAGLKIGIVGVCTQYVPHWQNAEHIKGLKFISAFDGIKPLVKKLRPQVDVLAVLYHGGFESDPATGQATQPHNGENEGYKILSELPEVDVILAGHQHNRAALVAKNTPIVQPGYRGDCIGEVVLDIEKDANGKAVIKNATAQLVDTKDSEPDQKVIDEVKDLDAKTQVWLDKPIAHMSAAAPIEHPLQDRLTGAPFINLIEQMELWFSHADVAATAIMTDAAHGFTQDVTMRQVLLNYPFSNQLCVVKVTGKELREIMEHAATYVEKGADGKVKFKDKYVTPQNMLFNFDLFYPIHYEVDVSKPEGERITKLELNGKPLDENKTYRLAVNNYRANGGGFYPVYSMDKIESTSDQDYVQMFGTFLSQKDIQVDTQHNYKFY